MSDTKDTGGNTGGRKPLTVSRKSSGTVKQSFSHGRSKQVVVETKKRRSVGPSGSSAAPAGDTSKAKPSADSMEARLIATAKKLGITVNELKARQKALYERKQEEAARAKEEENQKAAQDRLRSEQEKSFRKPRNAKRPKPVARPKKKPARLRKLLPRNVPNGHRRLAPRLMRRQRLHNRLKRRQAVPNVVSLAATIGIAPVGILRAVAHAAVVAVSVAAAS